LQQDVRWSSRWRRQSGGGSISENGGARRRWKTAVVGPAAEQGGGGAREGTSMGTKETGARLIGFAFRFLLIRKKKSFDFLLATYHFTVYHLMPYAHTRFYFIFHFHLVSLSLLLFIYYLLIYSLLLELYLYIVVFLIVRVFFAYFTPVHILYIVAFGPYEIQFVYS
jgi:hypothetical protein